MRILLKGGRVVDPSQRLDSTCDVLLVEGRVEACGPRVANEATSADIQTIDCTGLVVAPGFIDVHCHLREPGREDVETIATGARAAAAGGVTAGGAAAHTPPPPP